MEEKDKFGQKEVFEDEDISNTTVLIDEESTHDKFEQIEKEKEIFVHTDNTGHYNMMMGIVEM